MRLNVLPLLQYSLRHQSKTAAYWHPTFWYFTGPLQHFSSDPIDRRRRPIFNLYLIFTPGPLFVLSPCSGHRWAVSLEPASNWCSDPLSVCLRLAPAQGCCTVPDSWQEIDPRVWLHPVRALSPAQPMLPRQLYVTGFLSVPPTVSKAYPVSFFCLSFSFSPCHSPRRGALFPPGCAANARSHGCLQQVGPTQAKSDLGWLGRVFISCLFNEYEKIVQMV